jgi:hypothetical protein
MKMRSTKQLLVIIAVLAATTSLIPAETLQSSGKQSLVGTWQVLRHGVDCVTGERLGPDFPALMTFNKGGTLNAYAIPPNGSTPALTSPEYGVFNRESGAGNFSFRDVSYGYDSNGAFTGSSIITATGQLAADGNSFTYDGTIDFYDVDGNLLFSICGMATAARFE